MRVSFKVSELFTVSGEGSTQKEAFKDLAANVEPFAVEECGKCKSRSLLPVVRTEGKFTYYEMKCRKCRAKLSYGQSTENGALYPRRKYHEKHPLVKSGQATEGDWLPDNGWEVYVKEDGDGETATPKATQKRR